MDRKQNLIDCSRLPSLKDGLTITDHDEQGWLEWHKSNIEIWHPPQAMLYEEILPVLAGRTFANACLADWFLSEQDQYRDRLPELQHNVVFFFGTKFKDEVDRAFVRALLRRQDHPHKRWRTRYFRLKDYVFDQRSAIVLRR